MGILLIALRNAISMEYFKFDGFWLVESIDPIFSQLLGRRRGLKRISLGISSVEMRCEGRYLEQYLRNCSLEELSFAAVSPRANRNLNCLK